MALPSSGVLGIISGTGVTLSQSISFEVDGNEIVPKDLLTLVNTAIFPLPASMTDFYGYSHVPPDAPTNVVATKEITTISVTWDAPTTGGVVIDYSVLRRVNLGVWGNEVITTSTSLLDEAVVSGNDYRYRVTARNGAGDSASVDSNTVAF